MTTLSILALPGSGREVSLADRGGGSECSARAICGSDRLFSSRAAQVPCCSDRDRGPGAVGFDQPCYIASTRTTSTNRGPRRDCAAGGASVAAEAPTDYSCRAIGFACGTDGVFTTLPQFPSDSDRPTADNGLAERATRHAISFQ